MTTAEKSPAAALENARAFWRAEKIDLEVNFPPVSVREMEQELTGGSSRQKNEL